MKLNVLAMSVALVAAGYSAASVAAVADTVTVGVRGGWAFTDVSGSSLFADDEDSGYGIGAYVDYNFTDWFALEFGFNYFDGFSIKDSNKSYDYEIKGPELAVRFAYPLDADGSDIYFRAGAMLAYTDSEADDHNNVSLAPLVGVGVQYQFTRTFGVRIGYDHYFNVYDADGAANGLDVDSMGLVYAGFNLTFGGCDPEPAAAPVAVTAHQTLNADALFPFDGSTLSDEGKQAVSTVIGSADGLTDVQYDLKGYTDRIGSEEYNQALSERRVSAVANEFEAQGVAPSAITAAGYGESNSVVGDKCDGLKRADMIECLAPDRRVEITITGYKTEE